MDGILMNKLHGNLHLLCNESFKKLVNYYKTGTLSLQDRALLQKEITKHEDMLRVPSSRGLLT